MLTLRPGEREPDHIKHQILLEPPGLDVSVSLPVSSSLAGAPVRPATDATHEVSE